MSGSEGLKNQEARGLQGCENISVNWGTQGRGQVKEDAGSRIELGPGPAPQGEVGLLDGHRDASIARCFLSAFDANGRQVHGVDTEALAGKPDTVAAVTVPWNEDTRAGLKACHLRIGPFIGLQRNLPFLRGLLYSERLPDAPTRSMSREMLCCIFRCRR